MASAQKADQIHRPLRVGENLNQSMKIEDFLQVSEGQGFFNQRKKREGTVDEDQRETDCASVPRHPMSVMNKTRPLIPEKRLETSHLN
mmetsp:Transcript_18976/g.32424  ORF Transcript_18976/g.32424 Transcript_18976/m.32424 type:complete len:88 (+) Transcript_18976:740-1003(+)